MKNLSIYLPIYLSVILFLAGCSEANDPDVKKQPDIKDPLNSENSKDNSTGRTQAAQNFYDWSGQIEVLVLDNSFGEINHNVRRSVQLPADFVLVGGGAYTTGTEATGGAYLTGSWPEWFENRWYATSKDHGVQDLHTLNVYAVGLKIQGVTPETLRSVMTLVSNTSITATHPATFVGLPAGYQLIGGGAMVNWIGNVSGNGNLLVHSYPSNNYWNAKSKDHVYPNPRQITAYAIGIQDYIPGFGYIDIIGNESWANQSTTKTGYINITMNQNYVEQYYVATCVGARSVYPNSAGRLLTGLRPPNFHDFVSRAQSADCLISASGYLEGYLIQIRKRP